jgi:hypothetical protein
MCDEVGQRSMLVPRLERPTTHEGFAATVADHLKGFVLRLAVPVVRAPPQHEMLKAHALGARWPDELLSIAVHFCLHIWRKRVGEAEVLS